MSRQSEQNGPPAKAELKGNAVTTWNGEQLRGQFEQVKRMAQIAQDDCKRQVRPGRQAGL